MKSGLFDGEEPWLGESRMVANAPPAVYGVLGRKKGEWTVDQREEKLPLWARQLIDDLRKRVQYGSEHMVRELAKLRPENERLKARNYALEDLLRAAANGGHLTAQQVVDVIKSYEPWKEVDGGQASDSASGD